MSLRFTILGCGSSGGVPRIGGDWGNCDPNEPRNHRTRCSLLIERISAEGATTVLVDTSPDMRAQLLRHDVTWLDAVLFSHDHADHTHGIDDLRAIVFRRREQLDVYFDEPTRESLEHRFGYCFETPEGSPYPPILRPHTIEAGQPVRVDGAGGPVEAMPFAQLHGNIVSLGFRVGGLAYSSDISGLPEESLPLLDGLDVWIVDALRHTPHPGHYTVDQAVDAVRSIGATRGILTHMHNDLDYNALRRELPEGIAPAYDGMVIELPD
ncbi:MAG: MBL fold metallo-hydrolase [Dichotomicrobium sp.]